MSDQDPGWLNSDYEIREQDRWLPIANVGRVMKAALPPHAKLSKESKECVQECVSEFISFITSQSAERCSAEKRKTLNGEDVLWSMSTLGFENYAETLKIYLAKYRDFERLEAEEKKNKPRRQRKKPNATSLSGDISGAQQGYVYNTDSQLNPNLLQVAPNIPQTLLNPAQYILDNDGNIPQMEDVSPVQYFEGDEDDEDELEDEDDDEEFDDNDLGEFVQGI